MEQILSAYRSTKISGNSGTESNGTECFEKFVSKISVNLWRLSFFSKIWKFREFSVPIEVLFLFMFGPSSSPRDWPVKMEDFSSNAARVVHYERRFVIIFATPFVSMRTRRNHTTHE